VCSSFSDYFSDKITKLKQAVARDKLSHPTHLSADNPHLGTSFNTLCRVNTAEVLKIIRALPPKSSPLDFIPTSLIKSCSHVFSDITATLANLSFEQGMFRTEYKAAVVTPLLKKSGLDSASPANYRPVSNLSNI